jgi:pimeloyl-ACP methyl ester carboxylesterase
MSGCATRLLLHPDTARKAAAQRPVAPETFGDHPEIVTVTNQNNCRLTGWAFFSPTNHGVIVVGDGNATGIAQTYEYNRYLMNKGFNVLVLSYQGFDSNEGKADINSLYGDVETFYRFCRRRFSDQPIAFMAESISTAPFFCYACHHPEIKALIIEAMVDPRSVAFAKLNDWWLFYPFYPFTIGAAWLVKIGIPDNLKVREALRFSSRVPALFIHHPGDKVTPYRIARRIYADYHGPKQWVTIEKSHSWERHMTASYDLEINEQVLDFLKRCLKE